MNTARSGLSIASFLRTAAGARAAFVLLTTVGLLALILSPTLKRSLGILDFGVWFLDSYAVLAASDAVRAGINPMERNPLDHLHRPHSYSDWWFALGHVGLTRQHNFLVGGTWLAAFLIAAWATVRPRNLTDTACFTAILLSPSVLLAINRANNDLVVFALVAAALLLLRGGAGSSNWRIAAALLAIALATGLKFYPVVAAFVFLLLRPARRMIVAAFSAAIVLGLVLADVLPALSRGVFTIPAAVYTMGGAVLLRDIGLEGRSAAVLVLAVVAMGAVGMVRGGVTTGLAEDRGDGSTRFLFAAGAAMLVGCFLAGASFAYRWVFALWLAPWLLERMRDTSAPAAHRRIMRSTLAVLLVVLWIEGIYCVITNVCIGPVPMDALERAERWVRITTQPLTWALMIMLAGWIFDAVRAAWRVARTEFSPAS